MKYDWRAAHVAHQRLWSAWSAIGTHMEHGKRANVIRDIAAMERHLAELKAALSSLQPTAERGGVDG